MSKEKIMGSISRTVYYTIKEKATKLDDIDLMILSTALRENWQYEKLPAKQQALFKDIGMSVLKLLNELNSDQQNAG